jgi:hypothetical protein
VATINSNGLAYAATPSSVTITGKAGANSGTATLNVNAPSGYSPLVNDTFSGPAGYYLGSNWSGCAYDSGAYSPLVYENTGAGGSGYWSQNCAAYTGYGAFPQNQYATAVLVSSNPSSTPEAGVQIRQNAAASTPESYIACGWNAQDFSADYHYRIWSMQPNPPSGGPTSLYLSSVTPKPKDTVMCEVLGSSVRMNVNGKTIATVTDTSGVTGGYPGLYYIDPNGNPPAPTDVIWGNFVAGSLTTLQ